MITVIIPALNEQDTIAEVIALVKRSPLVSEIIVVDDKSVDQTVSISRDAGAKVITSTKLGKGASMKDGVLVAGTEYVMFLDADITTYPENIVDLMCGPLLRDEADFTKSYFSRQAGRVTELVARPLLAILYPEFPNFIQPLSGMIAGKTQLFRQIGFEEGYGVDIGILMDMFKLKVRISEINIGKLENRMQPLEQLGKMSKEVSRTIIKKSPKVNEDNLESYENIQMIREQMDFAIQESLMQLKKIAVFDMDNTILTASFIQTCSRSFGFQHELLEIVTSTENPFLRTKLIAKMLKGRTIGELLEVAESIPVTQNLLNLINALRSNGYIVGVISDSYDCITNHFRNKFGFDFTLANELEFSKSICTGEVKIPSMFMASGKSRCKHDYCKLNAFNGLLESYDVDIKNTIYIGDGENDICCVKNAGIGISFCSSSKLLDSVSDFVIKEPDFGEIITLVT